MERKLKMWSFHQRMTGNIPYRSATVGEDDKAIEYTVEEVEIEGYESSIAGSATLGFVITNTEEDTPIEPETTKVSVEKKWIGTVGENVTVNLLANGKKVKDVVLSSANDWKHTFTDLPTVDGDDKAIEYTVEEVEIEGYESSIAGSAALGFVITNTEEDTPTEPEDPNQKIQNRKIKTRRSKTRRSKTRRSKT